MKRRRSLPAIFAVPLVLTVLSTAGLAVALTGDGGRDVLSWVALAAPVAAVVWAMAMRRH